MHDDGRLFFLDVYRLYSVLAYTVLTIPPPPYKATSMTRCITSPACPPRPQLRSNPAPLSIAISSLPLIAASFP
jgi:hypothetical protein